MDNSNVTQLRTTTFNYDQIRGAVGAIMLSTGALSHTDNGWTLEFDREVPGLSTSDDMRFTTINEAVDFVLPSLMSSYANIISRAAA